jgi:hypothetical protein
MCSPVVSPVGSEDREMGSGVSGWTNALGVQAACSSVLRYCAVLL